LQVLTSKWCSEEGLEDATNLLLQLSKANNDLQEMVLKLLLEGAKELGSTVCHHIRYGMPVTKDVPYEVVFYRVVLVLF
jgi:E3 ubiquitin-protein ligase HUWE1